jgi:ABC-type oligopeptide transport system ATPase subunit
MKVIEVIGPSGSGKSTLSLSLQTHLNQSGTANIIVIGTKKYHGSHDTRFSARSARSLFYQAYSFSPALIETLNVLPHLMEPYRRGTHLNNPRYFRMFSLALKQTRIQKQLLKVMPEESVAIFDPGWFMRLLNGYIYATHEPEVETLNSFINKIAQPSLLVVLNVSPEVSLSRLSSRERGLPKRMRQLDEKKFRTVLNQGNKAASLIGKEALRNNINTLSFDSTHLKPDEIAHEVMIWLRKNGQNSRIDGN